MGGQKSVAIACVFTYHLPLRVLLLPEGGDLRYYRLFSQPHINYERISSREQQQMNDSLCYHAGMINIFRQ